MEEKLKNYSSGMQVRLAFSVAIQTNADILVLDEVLAVGDAAFQQKCFDYFEDLKNNKQTVVFVTHDMGAVRRFCSRAIYIEDGKIKHQGSPIDIADIYTEVNIDKSNQSQNQKDKKADTNQVSIEIVEPKKRSFSQGEELKLGVVVNGIKEQVFANFSLSANGIIFSDRNSRDMPNDFIQNGKKIEFVQPIADLNPGKYDVYISIHRIKDDSTLKHLPRAYSFVVKGKDILRDGPMRSMGEWR
jgi:ABC-2 type transport system ATP-binding protein